MIRRWRRSRVRLADLFIPTWWRTIRTHKLFYLLHLIWCEAHARWVEPILTDFTLHHQVIGVVWHLTFTVHSHTVRSEPASSCFILKAAEVVISTNTFQLCVVFKGVYCAFAFNSVCTLYVIVIRQKELLRTMELTSPSHRLFRPIIPSYPNFGVVSSISFNLLYLRNIWWFLRVLSTHQNTISNFHDLVRAFHSIRVESFLGTFGLRHRLTIALRPSSSHLINTSNLALRIQQKNRDSLIPKPESHNLKSVLHWSITRNFPSPNKQQQPICSPRWTRTEIPCFLLLRFQSVPSAAAEERRHHENIGLRPSPWLFRNSTINSKSEIKTELSAPATLQTPHTIFCSYRSVGATGRSTHAPQLWRRPFFPR